MSSDQEGGPSTRYLHASVDSADAGWGMSLHGVAGIIAWFSVYMRTDFRDDGDVVSDSALCLMQVCIFMQAVSRIDNALRHLYFGLSVSVLILGL